MDVAAIVPCVPALRDGARRLAALQRADRDHVDSRQRARDRPCWSKQFTCRRCVANIISVVVLGALNFVGADTLVFRAAAAALMLGVVARTRSRRTRRSCSPKRSRGFAKYVAAVEARRDKAIAGNEPFLDFERHSAAEQARIMATLQARRGVSWSAPRWRATHRSNEIPVDGGLINHWRGTVFVPNVKLDHAAEGAAGAAKRQAQTGRRALVARRVAGRRFAESVPAAAADEVRDGGLRHRVRRRLPASGARPRAEQQHLDEGRRDRECRHAARARAAGRQRLTATCGGSIPTGATSRSTAACWWRSSR